MYLKSTDPDLDPCEITDAFEALHGPCDAFYEHGQWFVWDGETGCHWAAHDCSRKDVQVWSGLTFEQIA